MYKGIHHTPRPWGQPWGHDLDHGVNHRPWGHGHDHGHGVIVSKVSHGRGGIYIGRGRTPMGSFSTLPFITTFKNVLRGILIIL